MRTDFVPIAPTEGRKKGAMIATLAGLWGLLAPCAGPQDRDEERRYPVTVQEAYKPWTLRHRIPPLAPEWRLVWERVREEEERRPARPAERPPGRELHPRP